MVKESEFYEILNQDSTIYFETTLTITKKQQQQQHILVDTVDFVGKQIKYENVLQCWQELKGDILCFCGSFNL